MNKKTVKDIDVKGKRVFVRVDFNVPMDKSGNITDDTRIVAALPTIRYLREQGAKVILASHLGRPKGKVAPEFRLDAVGRRLSELLGVKVAKVDDCIGDLPRAAVAAMQPGDVALLENLRFYAEEEANDEGFAKKLAELADVYVNDAFGAAHRAHASTAGIAKFLPAVAGLLMDREISVMGKALTQPARPFVAILGGAKVSDKIGVIENLLHKVDTLIIGGGMANTFLKAQGREVGTSLIEPEKIELARELLEKAGARGIKLLLPVDVVVADKFAADAQAKTVPANAIPPDCMALDIGPESVRLFAAAIAGAKTIVWNGPMGVFEFDAFAAGTTGIAVAVAGAGAVSIVGGGDSIAAVEKAGVSGKITHISTGGGASLEFLEGRELPGVAVLEDRLA